MAGSLQENLKLVQTKIAEELENNSKFGTPKIIAVSKKQSIEKIRELYGLGVTNFGENYLQEVLPKISELSDLAIEWHFIGAIQSKKIKDIVGKFAWIHSVSRLSELEKMEKICVDKSIDQKVLLQVNIADEESKNGFEPDSFLDELKSFPQFSKVKVRGMMVFPPISESEKETLLWFEKSFQLFKEAQKVFGTSFDRLSMGTSSDYPLAVRAGATDLRIGSTLMGARQSP